MINQGRFAGILYFENNLAPHVFTPDRLTVLKVLATQAAISLENVGLYRALADREAKIRRLVDANVLGICICRISKVLSSKLTKRSCKCCNTAVRMSFRVACDGPI